jgi:glycerophosphoryl diester phosphodiesterase
MPPYTKVIAHRGFSGIAPENTLIAFQKALDLGVDYIELDVHQTKDNVIVVIHDEDIQRTTNGAGLVKEMTFAELQKYDAGIWRGPAFKGEKIPTLAQVLALVNGKTKLLIEIKDTFNEYEGIEERTLELIERFSAKKWCVVQSFDDFSLERVKTIDAKSTFELHKLLEFEIEPLFEEIKDGVYRYVKAINVDADLLTAEIVAKIHAHKFKVYTWTVNTEEAIRLVIGMKVDGIISNFPDRVKKVLAEYEK